MSCDCGQRKEPTELFWLKALIYICFKLFIDCGVYYITGITMLKTRLLLKEDIIWGKSTKTIMTKSSRLCMTSQIYVLC